MRTDPMERLRAANPEPSCPPPPIEPVWRRIERDGYPVREPGSARVGRWTLGRMRLQPRVAGPIAALVIAVAVVAVVLPLFRHAGRQAFDGPASARQLASQLAVLRRPQTAADRLPAPIHISNAPGIKMIPGLTRLVRTLPNARLYLVVIKPPRHPHQLWNTSLGDQVAIVAVSGTRAYETAAYPAAELRDSNQVFLVSPTRPMGGITPSTYYVGIVPDGVSRVRWTFANSSLKPGASLSARAANNVAVAKPHPDTPPPVLRTAWFDSSGQPVATSNRALFAAIDARNARSKAQSLQGLLQHPHHAAPSLLNAFAIFAITSRTGVRTAAGYVVSRPRPAALPWYALAGLTERQQLDLTEARKIVAPSGSSMYIFPGAKGMCLVAGPQPSPFPAGEFGSGGGSTCGLLATVKERGLGETSGYLNVSTTYRIVPKTVHHITVNGSSGPRTIQVPDGIYVSTARQTSFLRQLCQRRQRNHPVSGVPFKCQ